MANHEGSVTSAPLRLHTVLLALAGRIDDGALGHARQLSAGARVDEAGELIAGTLIAGGIPLRPWERHELGEVFAASGADAALLDQLIVSEHDVDPTHAFIADDQPEAGVAAAIEPVKIALTDVSAIHAVWRNTAAGRVPGQVPQRLVLLELGAQGSPPATTHLVAAALRNAGIRAAVEVASADVAWTTYHQQALAAAVPIVVYGAESAPPRERPRQAHAPAPAPSTEPAPEPEPRAELASFFAAQEKPAFGAHSAPGFSNGEPAPTNAATDGVNGTNGHEAPRRTNGHHRAHRQPADAFRPNSVAEQAPAEPPRTDHPVEPSRNTHPVEPPRVDSVVEPLRDDHSAEPSRGNHAVAPPVNTPAEPPRTDYPAEPSRTEHVAEQVRTEQPVEAPRTGHPAEPTRADSPVEPQAPGGNQVLNFPESAVESTTEMSSSDAERLHQALREAEAADRNATQAVQREVQRPADAEAQLSDRDRELLRELHAELAKREREQAAQVKLNGWYRPGG
ncbi:MAG: hypothetical protein GEV04_07640 [Actinophytocola sp.]|nr:hypothetical protein [Actinophytocola sp.]